MQVTNYDNGNMRIQVDNEDLADLKIMLQQAEYFDSALVASFLPSHLGLPKGEQVIKIKSKLSSAQPSIDNESASIIELDETDINYISVFLGVIAVEDMGFTKNGIEIDRDRIHKISKNIDLITWGFESEDLIQAAEQKKGIEIPRFKL